MKTTTILTLVLCAGPIAGCAATVPKELVDARESYRRASTGPAAKVVPAEVHVANQALARAEHSFVETKNSYRTRDLAYVAERKAQRAEALATIAADRRTQTQAGNDFQATQGKIVTKTKQDLSRTRTALAASERSGDRTAEQLAAEQKARADAEKRAADAQAALAKLAAVREDPRGTIVTLSGSVLFASNQATLLPEARVRLGQVSEVLLSTRERTLTIEGYTDSQGSESHNMDLSQRRADAVRNYLVQSGYGADLVQAHGLGEGNPVADNKNAEGRANNRRVEIVIAREKHASK